MFSKHFTRQLHRSLAFISIVCLIQASTLFAAIPESETSHSLAGHGGPVNTLAVSPDGKTLLSGSLDYAVMVWDIGSKPVNMLKRFTAHQSAVSAVAYFPTSAKALSTGDDGNLYLWNLDSGQLQKSTEGHKGKTVSISISADETIAATASWDGTIRIWDLQTLDTLHEIKIHKETVNAVLLSPDNQTVYSAGYDGKIRAWRTESGELIRVLHENGWPVTTMKWLPGYQQIAFGSTNGEVQILDIAKQRVVRAMSAHNNKPVLGMDVSVAHNLLATGGNDGSIRVWRTDNWTMVGEVEKIPGPVWALAFAHDGRSLYYGSLDDEVQIWPVSTGADIPPVNKGIRRFQVTRGNSLGEVQFARKCSVCHTLKPGDANRAGPSLHQVFGRKAGSLPNYPYSKSLLESDLVWNEETIDKLFADGPHKMVPGTKMPLQKMPKDKNRKALIEYLKQVTQ